MVPKNKLYEIGREAIRKALLDALNENNWNLSHAAKALDLDATNILRAIKRFGCQPDLDAARADGRIRKGRPPKAIHG